VDGWDEVLLPVIDRYQARKQTVVVRADAAFALPALYEALERRDVAYAIRLPANQVLERTIEDLLTRSRGRPSYAPLVRYRSVQYQAASWDRPRRGIAKVEHHLGELFPRVGFIVATLTGRRAWSISGMAAKAGWRTAPPALWALRFDLARALWQDRRTMPDASSAATARSASARPAAPPSHGPSNARMPAWS
jgi:Transposase DDE domain group 1